MHNPLAYKLSLYIETHAPNGVKCYMPIGYITTCGLPVIYGLMWRIVNLDWTLLDEAPALRGAQDKYIVI